MSNRFVDDGSGGRRPGIPIVYQWLAAALAPPSIRTSLLDDLDEEFFAIQQHDGRPAARRWLRAQLLSSDWLRLRSTNLPHTKQAPRPTRGEPAMRTLVYDLTFAFRRVRHQPRFAAAVILTVAVGVLGAATVLGAVDAVLLQPLPYEEGHRLVTFQGVNEEIGITDGPVSLVNLGEWGELRRTFEGVFAVQGTSKVLSGMGPPQGLSAARLSPSALGILGIEPSLGRGFREEESIAGNDRVVMLSHDLWSTRFNEEPGAIGTRILLDSIPYEVVGVLPGDARLPNDLAFNARRDIWIPLAPEPGEMPRSRRAISGHARLADGVSTAAAQDAIDSLFASQTALNPDDNGGWTPRVRSVVDTIVGPFKTVLQLMMGAALMLALLACVNLINLSLAQGVSRRAELSIRRALGAARRRLVTQLLAEGVVLSVLGGLVGLLGTHWLLAAFTRWTPGNVPRLEQAAMSPATTTMVLAGATVIGLIFSGVPALFLTARTRVDHTRDAAASTGRWERRFLGTMVTAQVTLAMVLLIGAGLLGRSFVSLLGVDAGFETNDVLVAQLVLTPPTYPRHTDRTLFVRQALDRFAALPGVDAVGVTNFLPYSGSNTVDGFDIRDYERTRRQQAGFRAIDEGYLDVLRIPIVRGRALAANDMGGATPGALINETLAARFFPDSDPLGRFIERDEGWLQIVGVVADVRHDGPLSVAEPEWYAPFSYDPYSLKAFVLRTSVPSAAVAPLVRTALAELDPELAPLAVATMNEYLDTHLASPRFNMATLGAFALAAIIIAAQGVFGVVAQSVARRSREMGIRLALGAHQRRLRNRVVGEGLFLALVGVVLGLAAAMPLTRLLESLLLDISPSDPATFAGVAAFVVGVAALACYLPARRAASVDPLVVLRGD